jgi:DNA-binding NarL/FixJ family response regulator
MPITEGSNMNVEGEEKTEAGAASHPATRSALTRVLLVDAQAVVRAGLRLMINNQPGWLVSAEAASVREAFAQLATPPDVILHHANLPEEPEAWRELLALARHAPLLVLTGKCELETHHRLFGEAITAGLKGLVFREDAPDTLFRALQTVQAGGVWLGSATLARVLGKLLNVKRARNTDPEIRKAATLTPREREIVALLCQGLKNKSIAGQLGLSEATIRHALTSIFGKLGVTDRLELAIYAYRYGLHQLVSAAPPVSLEHHEPDAGLASSP